MELGTAWLNFYTNLKKIFLSIQFILGFLKIFLRNFLKYISIDFIQRFIITITSNNLKNESNIIILKKVTFKMYF